MEIQVGDRLVIPGGCRGPGRVCRVLEVVEEPDVGRRQRYRVSWFESGAVEAIDPGPGLVLLDRSGGSVCVEPGALSAQSGRSGLTPLRRVMRLVP